MSTGSRDTHRGDIRLGLDIGGTKVLGVAVDGEGTVHASVRLDTGPGAERVVEVATAAAHSLAGALGTDLACLAGIGVGVPGVVDSAAGVLQHAVNLGVGGDGLALAQRLRAGTGLPVGVENDVNAAAYGALVLLEHRQDVSTSLGYLSIGTGLAAGLVVDGRLHRGARGGAGEIGHIPVDPGGPVCTCGQPGCLEAVASGAALARAWPDADAPADALFRACAAGDPAATAVRDRFAGFLATAVQMLVLTADVDVVVLGGGVADVGKPLLQAVIDALVERAQASPFLASLDLPARVTLVPADRPVAAIGAALLAPGRSGP